MEAIWTNTDWTYDDLDKKRVEFHLLRGERIDRGRGEIWMRENPEGLMAIDLVTDTQGSHEFERIQTRWRLSQAEVDRIQRHPDPSIAEFLVVTAQ